MDTHSILLALCVPKPLLAATFSSNRTINSTLWWFLYCSPEYEGQKYPLDYKQSSAMWFIIYNSRIYPSKRWQPRMAYPLANQNCKYIHGKCTTAYLCPIFAAATMDFYHWGRTVHNGLNWVQHWLISIFQMKMLLALMSCSVGFTKSFHFLIIKKHMVSYISWGCIVDRIIL